MVNSLVKSPFSSRRLAAVSGAVSETLFSPYPCFSQALALVPHFAPFVHALTAAWSGILVLPGFVGAQ